MILPRSSPLVWVTGRPCNDRGWRGEREVSEVFRLHGYVTWAGSEGPALGLMLCCYCLKILRKLWTRSPTFSFYIGPCKLYSWSYSVSWLHSIKAIFLWAKRDWQQGIAGPLKRGQWGRQDSCPGVEWQREEVLWAWWRQGRWWVDGSVSSATSTM